MSILSGSNQITRTIFFGRPLLTCTNEILSPSDKRVLIVLFSTVLDLQFIQKQHQIISNQVKNKGIMTGAQNISSSHTQNFIGLAKSFLNARVMESTGEQSPHARKCLWCLYHILVTWPTSNSISLSQRPKEKKKKLQIVFNQAYWISVKKGA